MGEKELGWRRFLDSREPGEMLNPAGTELAIRGDDGELRFRSIPKRLGTEATAQPQVWQLQDFWYRGSLVLLYGAPDTYKTFLALDWANCISTGLPWQGHSTRDERVWDSNDKSPVPVLYVIAEGARGFYRRQEAWLAAHPGAPRGDLYQHPEPVDLLTRSAVGTHWLTTDDLLSVGARLSDDYPQLVIFDTLHRCMPGGSDVSDKDMGRVVESARRLQDYWDGCSVLLIHHSGWAGQHERGSNSLRGACDSVFQVKRAEGKVILKDDKEKDKGQEAPLVLRARKSADSLVLEPTRADSILRAERAIHRALEVAGDEGLTHGELAEATDLAKATLTRRVAELLEAGEVRKDGENRFFTVGATVE